ncbi:tRNA-specific adenosine deaminase [Phycisphaerales bacterium]|nr:tRNA-specific adenosine deaminase [Phycisphaerales bacterium]
MKRALWLSIGRRPARSAGGAPLQPTATDLIMMQTALSLARKAAERGEVPIGAAVYRTATGEIYGQGVNRRETDRDPAGHAEFDAIEQAASRAGDWRLNEFTLVVTLEPCAMCAGLIVNARVGRVVFGAPDPKAGAMGSLMRLTEDERFNHRVVPIAGVMGEECGLVLTEFFQKLRADRRAATRTARSRPQRSRAART